MAVLYVKRILLQKYGNFDEILVFRDVWGKGSQAQRRKKNPSP
jgi:hypothetical protein